MNMTDVKITVGMNIDMAMAISAYVEDQMNQEPDDETIAELEKMESVADYVLGDLSLIQKATVLYEDDRVILMEHPLRGDEVPMMAYFKELGEFEEETGCYEVSYVEEVMEDHRASHRSF